MTDKGSENKDGRGSVFLNERLITAACAFVVAASIAALFIIRFTGGMFAVFEVLVKLIIAVALFLAFRNYNWDVAKGLMGGALFCLMYREAYLVLGRLWGEEDFDTYLVAGVSGSIYLAAAGMSFLMTVIITINHFIINYAKNGNPENVILNRMAILFKFAVYVVLLISNSMLGFDAVMLWDNAIMYLTDMALLFMLVAIESQFDSFKVLRRELLDAIRKPGRLAQDQGETNGHP